MILVKIVMEANGGHGGWDVFRTYVMDGEVVETTTAYRSYEDAVWALAGKTVTPL